MATLDEAIARSSYMEHERDTWKERALKAEAELETLKASKRPAIFDEQSIAERIVKMEQSSVTATLRQEVIGLWARIAALDVQLREAQRNGKEQNPQDRRGDSGRVQPDKQNAPASGQPPVLVLPAQSERERQPEAPARVQEA